MLKEDIQTYNEETDDDVDIAVALLAYICDSCSDLYKKRGCEGAQAIIY